ncbi:MAG TPA: hypothetical protein VEW66_00520 [Thermomicrobiales bacterium]|nr:hypothetical protein [Thermomicrobiales bacterium]
MSASIHTAVVGQRSSWPLIGVGAGLAGFLATLVFDVHATLDDGAETDYTMAIVQEVSQRNAHLSIITGYLTVALLLIVAASWRSHVERRLPGSAAAAVVPLSFAAAAGALSLGYGWKGALGLYHADGNEPGTFDDMGLYVYYVLNDFGSFIGWLGVTVAAGAVAWLALKDRVLPLWIGVWSVLPVVAVLIPLVLTGLPGFPGVVSQIWMIVTFAGLAISKGIFTASSLSEGR